MNTRFLKLLSAMMLAAVLVCTVLAITSSAAITVEKGDIVGLDPTKTYEYAPVTLVDYVAPAYKSVQAGTSKLTGLSAGIYYIRETSTNTLTAVHIPGSKEAKNSIGTLVYNESWGKDELLATSSTSFQVGVWTGTGTASNKAFATYYLSEIGGSHIPSSVCLSIVNGSISRRKVQEKMESVVFKYAYTPEQMIAVEDLYTMGFNVGIRLGSLVYKCDTLPQTKYVLYTMDETGAVTQHVALHETIHRVTSTATSCSTSHTIVIENDFPNAKGWVIGLDVYPYGEVPTSANFDALYFENYVHHYYNTMYFIEYKPNAYATSSSTESNAIPSQYNGSNTAYINGYNDNSFAPDASITKAEAATILARLMLNGSTLPTGTSSKFADVSSNDWFFDEIAYLESIDSFDYTDSVLLYPNKAITRGELAQLIFTASKLPVTDKSHFKDVDGEYAEAIVSLADLGILNGYGDKTFRPNATITRAETVTVFNRIINLVANEKTVSKADLENSFKDISGHWAEYQILMAANNNVKSANHRADNTSDILMTDSSWIIETDLVKITVSRSTGKVTEMVNKADNTSVLASSNAPWFIYITTDSGITFYPSNIDNVDGRVRVKFGNRLEAYFLLDVKEDYFTLELDSQLPKGVKTLYFGKTTINSDYNEDPDSYRISSVAMNANTHTPDFPGGKAKATNAYVMRATGNTMGGKVGIVFSEYGDRLTGAHRTALKHIVDAIDPTVGITSKHGGAYALDCEDLFGDYLITSSGVSASTAASTAAVLNEFDIDQLDMHQGGSTFIQGNFNFACATVSGETFTTAKQFKERIGNTFINNGIQLGLHTYSSLVSSSATTILSDPKWQKDLAYEEDYVLTLASDVTASSTVFNTNEDASGLILYGSAAGGGISKLPWSGPNTNYFLIDEEIFRVDVVAETGLSSLTRGVCGTAKASHLAGAEIRHLFGQYSMFQPKPGSDLFYHIADLTAQAYNEGGFEMIYLDGLESFARDAFVPSSLSWYYYSTFIHRVVSGCDRDPIIEGSSIPQSFWAARGRAGAVDNATRQFKKYNYNHAMGNYGSHFGYFYTSTLGWFNYGPDVSQAYKNTWYKTIFIDDIDHMGALGIAFDMSTVYNHSVGTLSSNKTVANNCKYHTLYSKLRKGGYFSPAVKKTLQDGYRAGKEYKVEQKTDGTWAFREMKYVSNKIFDMADNTFVTGTANNPYAAHTPYVRIEQRYSTLGANEITVHSFDETADVVAGTYTFDALNLSSKQAFKIKVTGNGIEGSAMLLTLGTTATSEVGRLDLFIPTDFTGTREFILMDMDNADYDGYTFSGVTITGTNYTAYRNSFYFSGVNSVKITLTGDCKGVKIDDLRACTPVNAPAVNPSVTIGGKTMTFKTTVRSGEYIEYFPALNKAYLHSYNVLTAGTNGNTPKVTEISFTGSVSVPTGDFTYTYNATPSGSNSAPLRARVVLGLQSSELIENESSWTAPNVEIPNGLKYITLQ